MASQQQTPQAELPMDYAPALEAEMRDFYDFRWKRWHRAGSFDVAMQDPITRRCLTLAVQHLPHNTQRKKK